MLIVCILLMLTQNDERLSFMLIPVLFLSIFLIFLGGFISQFYIDKIEIKKKDKIRNIILFLLLLGLIIILIYFNLTKNGIPFKDFLDMIWDLISKKNSGI